jgi:type III pantothenate kinase
VLVAIDVGNTQTVIGAFSVSAEPPSTDRAPGELVGLAHRWRISTVRERTADEYALVLAELLGLAGLRVPGVARARQPDGEEIVVEGIVVSSSVPAITGAIREMAARWFDVPLVVIGPGTRTGMPVRYDNPREVGPDRIVDAVAALDLFGAPAIVVDCGTATTFDVVTAGGDYLGGVILPGMGVSAETLASRTARLPSVEIARPDTVLGRSTVESIQSGLYHGHTGAIRHLVAELSREAFGGEHPHVLGTGGFARMLESERLFDEIVPELVLLGLRHAEALNRDAARA